MTEKNEVATTEAEAKKALAREKAAEKAAVKKALAAKVAEEKAAEKAAAAAKAAEEKAAAASAAEEPAEPASYGPEDAPAVYEVKGERTIQDVLDKYNLVLSLPYIRALNNMSTNNLVEGQKLRLTDYEATPDPNEIVDIEP